MKGKGEDLQLTFLCRNFWITVHFIQWNKRWYQMAVERQDCPKNINWGNWRPWLQSLAVVRCHPKPLWPMSPLWSWNHVPNCLTAISSCMAQIRTTRPWARRLSCPLPIPDTTSSSQQLHVLFLLPSSWSPNSTSPPRGPWASPLKALRIHSLSSFALAVLKARPD